MNIVLGSGPAATFCALALLESGAKVVMIDPGETIEKDRQIVIDEACGKDKRLWNADLYRVVRENTNPNVQGLPKKLVYGSDYPFRWLEPGVEIIQKGVDTLTSHALGGLSNAWGANILPLLAVDTDCWPFPISNLDPYYKKVSEHIPVAADESLSSVFPQYGDPKTLPQSKQAAALLRDAARHEQTLKVRGMHIGRSRLAVKAEECVACGLCLYGCPNRLIYSAAFTLPKLQSFEKFTYKKGFVAKAISERSGRSFVVVQDIVSGTLETIEGERVFVGCGAVNSTALVLRSLGAYGVEIKLKDSQYFLTPYMRFSGVGDVFQEELHTLSQIALEIIDPALCNRSVHILFYTYNDLYRRALDGMLGPFGSILRPAIRAALSRLVIMQGYLHSDYSGEVGVRLEKGDGDKEKIFLTSYVNQKTASLVKKIHQRMTSMWRVFRGLPVSFMSHIGAPGKSYHLGGSLPMKLHPQKFETDLVGRPYGMERIHVVDASIFPNVPATNVTLTAMANAYRIGLEAGGS